MANVEVIGINRLDQESNNPLVTADRTLPWLQDTDTASQWASWGAVWRDVRIVSSRLELAGVYNLTPNDLGNPANRATLKQMIMESVDASQADADEDGLRDDWEQAYLGDLASTSGAEDDPDGDGSTNFAEYAFGSHPRSAASLPQTAVLRLEKEDGVYPVFAFWRRAGSGVTYACENSADLVSWAGAEAGLLEMELRPAYDGRGTFLSLCTRRTPFDAEARDHFRVRADR